MRRSPAYARAPTTWHPPDERCARRHYGGLSGGVPPLPIPNREVKPACADGTAMKCGRVGSRPLIKSKKRVCQNRIGTPSFCCYVRTTHRGRQPSNPSMFFFGRPRWVVPTVAPNLTHPRRRRLCRKRPAKKSRFPRQQSRTTRRFCAFIGGKQQFSRRKPQLFRDSLAYQLRSA